MNGIFETPIGGVMTVEVGAITGEVEVSLDADSMSVTITYVGSDDVYTVEGSPVPQSATVEQIVAHLSVDPGVDADENPKSVDLRGFLK